MEDLGAARYLDWEGADLLRKVTVSSGRRSALDSERAMVVCFPGRDHAGGTGGLFSKYFPAPAEL